MEFSNEMIDPRSGYYPKNTTFDKRLNTIPIGVNPLYAIGEEILYYNRKVTITGIVYRSDWQTFFYGLSGTEDIVAERLLAKAKNYAGI